MVHEAQHDSTASLSCLQVFDALRAPPLVHRSIMAARPFGRQVERPAVSSANEWDRASQLKPASVTYRHIEGSATSAPDGVVGIRYDGRFDSLRTGLPRVSLRRDH